MPTINNMREVLASLVKKTEMQKIRWDLDHNWDAAGPQALPERQGTSVFTSSFIAHFPHSIIRAKFVEADNGLNYAQFIVEELEGGMLGDWIILDGDPDWSKAHELFKLVADQCSSKALARLVEQIEQSNQMGESENANFQDDLATQFFKRIAGQWHLTYYRGKNGFPEDCRIDAAGQYFVEKKRETPYFYLSDVFYDPEGNNVSFAKVEAAGPKKGKTRQVEVLQIDPKGQWMKGYAQDDGHRLEYVRRESSD